MFNSVSTAGGSSPGLKVVREKLRTSLWLVPTLMAITAIAISAAATSVDAVLADLDPAKVPIFVFVSTPSDARDVLSSLLTSMITMTSLVFSITMVVLSLAANQFGPRLIRSFMSARHTQLALGTFIMTSVYCLLQLASVGSSIKNDAEAYPSVSFGIALTLMSVLVLVAYLHFLARSIVSETVIKRLGSEITDMLSELDDLAEDRNNDPEKALPEGFDQNARFFGPSVDGFVQSIDVERLCELAQKSDVFIGFSFKPGDYVITDGGGIGIFPASRWTQDLQDQVCGAVVIGSRRTSTQDPEFAIRHLVEMAIRALSPGINDPYTAVAVLAQLSAGLAHLMRRALPSSVIAGSAGEPRIVLPRATYASLVGAAFNQIRQNAAGKPFVIMHLIEAIQRIADHAQLSQQCDLLDEHLSAVVEAVGDVGTLDQEAIRSRAEAAREAIAKAKTRITRKSPASSSGIGAGSPNSVISA
ncbi:putative membrane protein [Pseudorhizobium tarimense]|uniref:Membrane protein n=1 Tax=Pseudorhizobium tarimense TaxID=1079109 RepID=A0ABV2H573_9HYPH|nr:DUF2254 domain-containing protein [Pseudorhizobium tarimense]MCJ8518863.1 DUF2254 domain-containing protein [Pseudorhizobium tarimense]